MRALVVVAVFVLLLTAHQLVWHHTHRDASRRDGQKWWSRSDPANPSPLDRCVRLAASRPAVGIPLLAGVLGGLGFVIGADGYGRGTTDEGVVLAAVMGVFGLLVGIRAAHRARWTPADSEYGQ